MSRLLNLAGRLVCDRRRYLFFRARGTGRAQAPGGAIRLYSKYEEIPSRFREIVLPSPRANTMFYRLNRGDARLMCYSEDGRRLQAYSWLQSWRPFRRRFGPILGALGAPPACEPVMSGPSWTAHADRGKGICTILLRRKLELCERDALVVTHTLPENVAPQKAAIKAGFEPVGCWEITLWLRLFPQARRLH